MTIFGWDASDFDWDGTRGTMDLGAARRAGIDFFTHKATEGTSVVHQHFGTAMSRARAAGIPVLGAYHVARSANTASAQVDFWVKTVTAACPWWVDHPAWFWQVDLEKWPYDAVAASRGEEIADLVEQRTGRTALIYGSKVQYGDSLTGTSHNLWNANYPHSVNEGYMSAYNRAGGDSGPGWTTYSGRMPVIWQYTSHATIGTQTTCDANAYRGTLAQFLTIIGASKPAPVPVLEVNMPLYGKLATDQTVWVSDGLTRRDLTSGTAWSAVTAVGAKVAVFTSDADLTDALGPVAIAQPTPTVEPLDYVKLVDELLKRAATGTTTPTM